jgi:hypothetical protein
MWEENHLVAHFTRLFQNWHARCMHPFAVKKWNRKEKGGENIMAVEKTIGSSSLVEVIDRILDKGIVVDAWVRVSLVGIEILAIEARVVAASVETYLKYAEAIGLTATAAA